MLRISSLMRHWSRTLLKNKTLMSVDITGPGMKTLIFREETGKQAISGLSLPDLEIGGRMG
ncbi:hypothetical protein KDK_52910 [Dictyobacter kobayashii]|uniref:Uncharacterized protein n=1 Tax=Dictyobacter kobayashii TaxID=2014872 RepID=A0A402AQX0_9CHLR|nr:hypothetical protein KDK_52910 [Dictyobacter kobayashii]